VREGTHVPDSATVTVTEAGKLWIKVAERGDDEREPLERATVVQYKQHLSLHIEPFLGRTKLSQISTPLVRKFASDLRAAGRSATMVKYVVRSLGALIAEAQEAGLISRNPVRDLRRNRKDRRQEGREHKLKSGFDYPTPEEISAMIRAADQHWRPLLLTAVFTGMRASELRGLRLEDIDLTNAEIRVRQRADKYGQIGRLKSRSATRTIPLPSLLVRELREWKLRCAKGPLGLAFPNGVGNIETLGNIVTRGFQPILVKAGVTAPVLDEEGRPTFDENGEPVVTAKYTGLHVLRHYFASWCINRVKDGGRELPLKVVSELMGHSSIGITANVYGHIFPRRDDSAALDKAAGLLFGLSDA
jgi:integrase